MTQNRLIIANQESILEEIRRDGKDLGNDSFKTSEQLQFKVWEFEKKNASHKTQ